MDLALVHSELRSHVKRIPKIPVGNFFGRTLLRLFIRTLRRKTPASSIDGVKLDVLKLDVLKTSSELRVFTPSVRKSRGALLWIHGGGYVVGTPAQDDLLCARTAREVGIVVVSVEYRLAPEHPFPASLDDCYAGWVWLQQSAENLAIDPCLIAIGGLSAGGGLAAALVQRVCDTDEIKPAAQWLFCPMLDDRTAVRTDIDPRDHFVWDNHLNKFAWGAYLGVEPDTAILPRYASPARRENLSGLPKTWIGVGDIDLFYDEILVYADRLRLAGVAVDVYKVGGAPHGFEAWASNTVVVQSYIALAQRWLCAALFSFPSHGAAERK